MKKILVIFIIVAVIAAAFLLQRGPEVIQGEMTVCTTTGETAEIQLDLCYYPKSIVPSYVKGTITVDGVAYIDQYTKRSEYPKFGGNHLFPEGWWEKKQTIPYNLTFVKADCTDVIAWTMNRIDILNIELRDGVGKIHYMYTDESNMVDGSVAGISFWGPAENAQEARQIAQHFGYAVP